MTKKLWLDEKDSKSIVKSRMHFVESEDKIHLEDVQDVEPLINANKKEANLGADAYKMKGELGKHAGMTKVASIPLIVVQQLAKKGIMSHGGQILDHDRMKKWLNDPDNRFFRIYQGNL